MPTGVAREGAGGGAHWVAPCWGRRPPLSWPLPPLLKQQIAGLQDEFRRNETHWHAAHGELKNQVETLTKQNLELQEELRISELQRIDVERQHGIWPPVSFSDTNTNLMGKKNPLRAQSDMAFNQMNVESVFTAVLRGASSEEEKPLQDSHKISSSRHMGRKKTPMDELVPGDRNTKVGLGIFGPVHTLCKEWSWLITSKMRSHLHME
uniref:Uncharacterized protein n=1 Tax=Salvator merianae TaxID=96440 RepID=A0A8D0EB76_SALMN